MKKINKTKARKLWNNDKEIFIVPCNMSPASPWYSGSCFCKSRHNQDFDDFIFQYEYYNCVDSETGKRASYYV